MSGRKGFSLPEVLIAVVILTVLMFPVILMFLSSANRAGQDVREIQAMTMAQEILEQTISAHRRVMFFGPVPAENGNEVGTRYELDLEERLAARGNQVGFPLFLGTAAKVSRMILSPSINNFKRYLAVSYERVGKADGAHRSRNTVYRVTARVAFTTPRLGGDVVKDVKVTTLLFTPARWTVLQEPGKIIEVGPR